MESKPYKKKSHKTPSKPPQNPQLKSSQKKTLPPQAPKIFSNPDSLEDFESVPLELATKNEIFEIQCRTITLGPEESSPTCSKPRSTSLEEKKEDSLPPQKKGGVSQSLNSNELISKLKSENIFLRNENNLLLKKLRFSEQKNNELLKVKGFTISLDKLEGKEEEELLLKLNEEKRRNEETDRKINENNRKIEDSMRKIGGLETLLEKISTENESLKNKENVLIEEVRRGESETERKNLFINDLEERLKVLEEGRRELEENLKNMEMSEFGMREENSLMLERIRMKEKMMEENADYFEKEVRKLKELIQIAEKELFEWKFKYDQNVETLRKKEEMLFEAQNKIEFLNIEKGILAEENQEINLKLTQLMNAAKIFNNPHSETTNQLLEEIKTQLSKSQIESQRFKVHSMNLEKEWSEKYSQLEIRSKNKMSSHMNQIENLKEKMTLLFFELERLEVTTSKSNDELKCLKKENNNLIMRGQENERIIEGLKMNNKDFQKNKEVEFENLVQTNTLLLKSQNEREFEDFTNKFEKEKVELIRENTKTKNLMELREGQVEDLKKKLTFLDFNNIELRNQINQLTEIKMNSPLVNEIHVSILQKENLQMKRQLEELKMNLEENNEIKNNLIEDLRSQLILATTEKNINLVGTCQDEYIAKLLEKIIRLQILNDENTLRISGLELRNSELKSSLAQQELEKESLKLEISNLKKEIVKFEQMNEEIIVGSNIKKNEPFLLENVKVEDFSISLPKINKKHETMKNAISSNEKYDYRLTEDNEQAEYKKSETFSERNVEDSSYINNLEEETMRKLNPIHKEQEYPFEASPIIQISMEVQTDYFEPDFDLMQDKKQLEEEVSELKLRYGILEKEYEEEKNSIPQIKPQKRTEEDFNENYERIKNELVYKNEDFDDYHSNFLQNVEKYINGLPQTTVVFKNKEFNISEYNNTKTAYVQTDEPIIEQEENLMTLRKPKKSIDEDEESQNVENNLNEQDAAVNNDFVNEETDQFQKSFSNKKKETNKKANIRDEHIEEKSDNILDKSEACGLNSDDHEKSNLSCDLNSDYQKKINLLQQELTQYKEKLEIYEQKVAYYENIQKIMPETEIVQTARFIEGNSEKKKVLTSSIFFNRSDEKEVDENKISDFTNNDRSNTILENLKNSDFIEKSNENNLKSSLCLEWNIPVIDNKNLSLEISESYKQETNKNETKNDNESMLSPISKPKIKSSEKNEENKNENKDNLSANHLRITKKEIDTNLNVSAQEPFARSFDYSPISYISYEKPFRNLSLRMHRPRRSLNLSFELYSKTMKQDLKQFDLLQKKEKEIFNFSVNSSEDQANSNFPIDTKNNLSYKISDETQLQMNIDVSERKSSFLANKENGDNLEIKTKNEIFVAELQRENSFLNEQNTAAEKELQTIKIELRQLEEKLIEEVEKKENFEVLVDKAQIELDEMTLRLNEKERKINLLHLEEEKLNLDVEKSKNELEIQIRIHLEKEEEISNLNELLRGKDNDLRSLKEMMEEKEKIIEDLAEQKCGLEKQLNEAVHQQKEEIITFNDEINGLREDLMKKSEFLKLKEQEIEEFQLESKEILIESVKKGKQIEEALKLNEDMKIALELTLKQKEEENINLNSNLDSLKNELEMRNQEMISLGEHLEKVSQENDSLITSKNTVIQELQEQSEKLQLEKNDLNRLMTENLEQHLLLKENQIALEIALKQGEEENKNLNNNLTSLTNDFEMRNQEIISLRENQEKSSNEKDSLITCKNALIEKLEERSEKLELEKIELNSLINEKLNENLLLKEDKIITLEAALKQKDEENINLNNDLDSLKNELEMKHLEIILLKENIVTISNEKDSLITSKNTVIEKLQEQSEKMELDKNEQNRSMKEKINENLLFKENIQDLNLQMNKLMNEKNELIDSQNELIKHHTNQMRDFDSQNKIILENKEKEMENLVSELTKFQLEKNNFERALETKQTENTHLLNNFSNYEETINNLSAQNNILENEKQLNVKQILELNKKYTNLESRNKNILTEYLSLNSEFELIKEKYDVLKFSESATPDLEKMKMVLSKQDNLTENLKLNLMNLKQEKAQILKEKEDYILMMENKSDLKEKELICLQSKLPKTSENQGETKSYSILQLEQLKQKGLIEESSYFKAEASKLSIELSTFKRLLDEERSTSSKKYSDLFEKYEFLLSCAPSEESSRLRGIITKNEAKIEHLLSLQNYHKSELRSLLSKDPKLLLDQAAQTEKTRNIKLMDKSEQTDQETESKGNQRNRRNMPNFSSMTPMPQRNRSFYESSHFFVSPRKSERNEGLSRTTERGCLFRTEPSSTGKTGKNEFSMEYEEVEERKQSIFIRNEEVNERKLGNEEQYDRVELNPPLNMLANEKNNMFLSKNDALNLKQSSIAHEKSQLKKTSLVSQNVPSLPQTSNEERELIPFAGEKSLYDVQPQSEAIPFSAFEQRFRSERRKRDRLSLEKFDLIQKLGVTEEDEGRREVIRRLEEIDQMFNLNVDYGNEERVRKEGRMMEEEIVDIKRREEEEEEEEKEEEKGKEENEEEKEKGREVNEEEREGGVKMEDEKRREEEIFKIIDDLNEENIEIFVGSGFFEENNDELRRSIALKIEEKTIKLEAELKLFEERNKSFQESAENDETSLKIFEQMTSLYPEHQAKKQEILSNLSLLSHLKELNSLSFLKITTIDLTQKQSETLNVAQTEISLQRKRLVEQLREVETNVGGGEEEGGGEEGVEGGGEKIKKIILARKINFLDKIEKDPEIMNFLNAEGRELEELEEEGKFEFLVKQAEIVKKTRSKNSLEEDSGKLKKRRRTEPASSMSLEQINSSKRDLIRKLSKINVEHSNRSEVEKKIEYRAQMIEKAEILEDLSRLRKIEEVKLVEKNANYPKIEDIRRENEELDEIVRTEKVIMINKLKEMEQEKLEIAEKKGDFAQKLEAISKIVKLNKSLGRLEEPLSLENLFQVKFEEKDCKSFVKKKLALIKDLEKLSESPDQKEEALVLLEKINRIEELENEEKIKEEKSISPELHLEVLIEKQKIAKLEEILENERSAISHKLDFINENQNSPNISLEKEDLLKQLELVDNLRELNKTETLTPTQIIQKKCLLSKFEVKHKIEENKDFISKEHSQYLKQNEDKLDNQKNNENDEEKNLKNIGTLLKNGEYLDNSPIQQNKIIEIELLEKKEKLDQQLKTIEECKQEIIRGGNEKLNELKQMEIQIKNSLEKNDPSFVSPTKEEKGYVISYDSPEEREYRKAKEILEERLSEFHRSNEKMSKLNEEIGLKSEKKLKNKLGEMEKEKDDAKETIKNNDNVDSNSNTNRNKEIAKKNYVGIEISLGNRRSNLRKEEEIFEKSENNDSASIISKSEEISDNNKIISANRSEKFKLLERLYEVEKLKLTEKFEETKRNSNSFDEKDLIMGKLESLEKLEKIVNTNEQTDNPKKLEELENLKIQKESSKSDDSFSIRKDQLNEEDKIDLTLKKSACENLKELETPKFINQKSNAYVQIQEFDDSPDEFPEKSEKIKRNVNSQKANQLLIDEAELSKKIELLKSIQNSLKNESFDEKTISDLKINNPQYENLDQREISNEIAENSQLLNETREKIKCLTEEPKLKIIKRINFLQNLIEESDDLKKNESNLKIEKIKEFDQDLSGISIAKEFSNEIGHLFKIINNEEENKLKKIDNAKNYNSSSSSEHSLSQKNLDDLPNLDENQLFKKKSTKNLNNSNDFMDIQSWKEKIEFLESQLEVQKSEKTQMQYEFGNILEENKQLEKKLSKFLFAATPKEEVFEKETKFKNIKLEKNFVIEKLNLLQELKDLKISTYENFENESVLQTERDELNLKERKLLENLIFLEEKQIKIKNVSTIKNDAQTEKFETAQRKEQENEMSKDSLIESNKLREILVNDKNNDGTEILNGFISKNREELEIKASEIEKIEKKVNESVNLENFSENKLMNNYRILLEEKEILNEKLKVLEETKNIIETKNLKESRENDIYSKYPEFKRISDNYEEEIRRQSVLLQGLELKEKEFGHFEKMKKEEESYFKSSDTSLQGRKFINNLDVSAEVKDNKEKLFELIQNIKEKEADEQQFGESNEYSDLIEQKNVLIEKMKILKDFQNLENLKKELQIISEEESTHILKKNEFLSKHPEIKNLEPKSIERKLQIKEQVLIERLEKLENDNLLIIQKKSCNILTDQNDLLKADLQKLNEAKGKIIEKINLLKCVEDNYDFEANKEELGKIIDQYPDFKNMNGEEISKEIENQKEILEEIVNLEQKVKSSNRSNRFIVEEKDEIIPKIILQEKKLIIDKIQALEELNKLECILLDSSISVDNFAKILIENKIEEIQREYPQTISNQNRNRIIQMEKEKLNELENLSKQEDLNKIYLTANEKKIVTEKIEILEEYKKIVESLKDPNNNSIKHQLHLRMEEINKIYPQAISNANIEELLNKEKVILFELGKMDLEKMNLISNEKIILSNKIETLSEFEQLKRFLDDPHCSFDVTKKNEVRLRMEQIVEEYPDEAKEGEINEIITQEKNKYLKLDHVEETLRNELKLYQLTEEKELRFCFSTRNEAENKCLSSEYQAKNQNNIVQIKRLDHILKEKDLASKKLEILEEYAQLQSILIENDKNLDYNLKNEIELKKEEIRKDFPRLINDQNYETILNEERAKILEIQANEIETREKLRNSQNTYVLKSGFSSEKERLKEEVIKLEEMKNSKDFEQNIQITVNDIEDEQKKLLQKLKEIENLEKLIEIQNMPTSNEKINICQNKKTNSSENLAQIYFSEKKQEYQELNKEKEKIIEKIYLLKNLHETSNEEKKEIMDEIIEKYPEFNNIEFMNIDQEIETQRGVLSEKMKEIESLEIDLKMGQKQENNEKNIQIESTEKINLILHEKEVITNKIQVLEEYRKLNEILVNQKISIDAQSKQKISNRIERIKEEYPEQITEENVIQILTQEKAKLINLENFEAKLKVNIDSCNQLSLFSNEKQINSDEPRLLAKFDELNHILLDSKINLDQSFKNQILAKIIQLKNTLSEKEKQDGDSNNQANILQETLISEKEIEKKEAESRDFEALKNFKTEKMIIDAKLGLLEKSECISNEPENEEKFYNYFDSPAKLRTPDRVLNQEEITQSKLILIQKPEEESLLKKFEIFDELQNLMLQDNNPDLRNILSNDFFDKIERVKTMLIEKYENKEEQTSLNKFENPLNFKKKLDLTKKNNDQMVTMEHEENYKAIIENFHSQADVENEKKRLSLRLEEIDKIRQKIVEEKHLEFDDSSQNLNNLEANIVISTPKFFKINKMEKLLSEEKSFILKKLEGIDNSDTIEEKHQIKQRNITCETETDPFFKKSDFNLLFSTKNSENNEKHRPINFEEIISEKNELNNKIRDLISRNEELKLNYENKIKEMQSTNSYQELPVDFSRKDHLEKAQSSPSMQINETHKQEISKLNQDLEHLKTKFTKIASNEKPRIKRKEPNFSNFTIFNRNSEAVRILIEQVVYEGLKEEITSGKRMIRGLEEQMEDFDLIKRKFQELNEEYIALEEKYTLLKNRKCSNENDSENRREFTTQKLDKTVDFQENEQKLTKIDELEGRIREMEERNEELAKLNEELKDQIKALTNERFNFLKMGNEEEFIKEAKNEEELKYKNNESKKKFESFHIGSDRVKEEEKVEGWNKDEKIEGLCDKIAILTQENELLHKEFLEMKNKLDEIRDNKNHNDKFSNFERNFDDLKNLLMKHELKLEEFRNEKKPFEFSIERQPENQVGKEIIENKEDLSKEVDKWKKRAIYLATERQYLMKQRPDQKDPEPFKINFESRDRSSNKTDLLKRIKHLEDEKASLTQKLENLKLELSKYEVFFKNNAVFELEKKNRLSNERILSLQDEIEFLTKKYELAVDGKNKENDEYRTQNKNFLLDNQRLKRTNEEFQSEIERLNLQLENFRKIKESSERNATHISSQSIFNDQTQEINTLLAEIDRLNEIIDNKNTEISSLIEENKKLAEKIEELSVSNQEHLKKEKVNKKNEEKNKAKQDELIKLLEERNKKNEEKMILTFEEKRKVLEQKNDNMIAEIEKRDGKLEALQQETNKLKKIEEKNKKIADDLQQKLNENISSMHMIEEIENSLKRTEDRLKKNGHTIRQSNPNQAIYERITEISLRLSDENLKNGLTLERQNKKLKDIYNELEIQQEKNKELELTIQNIEEENENLLSLKAEELKNLQLTHKDELSSFSSSHKSVIESLRNQHFNELNELRSQNQAKMSSITLQYQNEIVELQNKTAMLLENQLNSELANLHTKHKNQIETLKTQIESQKSDFEAKILNLKEESQAKLFQMENDNIFYIDRIKDLENGRVRDLENEITRLKNRNLENEVKIEKLDKKLNERSLELNRKQIEVEDLKKKIVENQNRNCESFENLKIELEKGIKSKLAEELKIVYENFEEEKSDLTFQIDEWRNKCEMIERDLVTLLNIDEKYKLALKDIETKISDLESLLSQKVQNFDNMKSILLSNLRSSLTSQFEELESEKHSIFNQLQLEQQKNMNLEKKIMVLENGLAQKQSQKEELDRNQAKKQELERKLSENVIENVNFIKEKAGYEREILELRDKVRELEEKERRKESKGLKENKKVVEMKLKRK